MQRDIWDKLDALKTALVEARVMSGEGEEQSFWDIMEPSTSEADFNDMIFEDFPENTSALYIIQT